MKVTIDNRTNWNTDDLARFFKKACRVKRCKRRVVHIRYGKGRALNGWGELPGTHIQITLPGPEYVQRRGEKRAIDYLELAQTVEHELDHTLGKEHYEMPDLFSLRPKWQKGLKIRWGDPKHIGRIAAKRKRSYVERKFSEAKKEYERARKKYLRWKRKLK